MLLFLLRNKFMQANEKWVDRPEVESGELSLLLQGYLNSGVPIIVGP